MSLRTAISGARPSASTPHLTAALRNAYAAVRTTSTFVPANPNVGPESPSYIEVPRPATLIPAWKVPKKGFVPKPRNVLKNSSNRLPKHTPEFLSLVTPEPKTAKIPPPDTYGQEKMRYKDQLSASRRRNLREGILELHEKREAEREKRRRIAERRQRERDEILAKAASDDVKYTLPTIDRHLREPMTPVELNPKKRLAVREQRYKKLMFQHRRQNEELVHSMYQNAGSFILTEAALDEVILARFNPEVLQRMHREIPPGVDFLKGTGMMGQPIQSVKAYLEEELDSALTGGPLPEGDSKRGGSVFESMPRTSVGTNFAPGNPWNVSQPGDTGENNRY